MQLPRLERLKGAAPGYGLFFFAHNVSNVLNYMFLLVMSQFLAADDFALFAALFGGIYFASALANTARVSVAAAVAASDRCGVAIVGSAVRRLALMALALPPAVLLAAPLVAAYLHSADVLSVGLVGVAIWLSMLAAVGYGGLQGSERFGLLAVGLLIASLGRLVFGPYLAWAGLGVSGALLGVVIGLLVSTVLVLAPFRQAARQPTMPPLSLALPGMLPAFLSSVAITIPTSADVILARHYLPGSEAGAYAAVSVLGKIIIFAPTAVSLLSFPRLVRQAAEGTPTASLQWLTLAMSAGLAVPCTVTIIGAVAFFPDIVLRGYQVSVPFLAVYVTAMLAFSLAVVVLYISLAERRGHFVSMTLPTLVVELIVIALWHQSALAIAMALLVGNGVLLLAGLWLTWGRSREERRAGAAFHSQVGAKAALSN